jgi:hypothetical protein
VLGLIFLWQVWKLRTGARKAEPLEKASSQGKTDSNDGGDVNPDSFHSSSSHLESSLLPREVPDYEEHPYKQHPRLTTDIQKANVLWSVALAGWLFVLTEGVGLTIYFSMSAALDNFAIFFVKGSGVCATVKAFSLYTMAVVTFLPNVLVGSGLQKKLYNGGTWKSKILFAVIMACITAVSFVARMWLVYTKGYVLIVNAMLSKVSSHWRVALAVAVPPIVDGIQSTALIMTGSHAKPLLAVMIDDMRKGQQELRKGQKEIQDQILEMQGKLDTIEKALTGLHDMKVLVSEIHLNYKSEYKVTTWQTEDDA